MAKYVEFNIPNRDSVYIEVNDFNLETIKNLPQYNEKWFSIICWEGEPRYYEEELLDIYPGKAVKKIYYGKKISYEEVKQIIGNDLKYRDLLSNMVTFCRNFYGDYCRSNNMAIEDVYAYREGLEDFMLDFDKTHYCLFTLPNRFSAEAFFSENTISVEEFDPTIKLDYDKQLNAIRINSEVGKEYIERYKFYLEMFNNFFNVLIDSSSHFFPENYNELFSLLQFNFTFIDGINSIEDINFFLEVFAYTYDIGSFNNDLFEAYKNYIGKEYEKGIKFD